MRNLLVKICLGIELILRKTIDLFDLGPKVAVIYSSHTGTDKENIGDVFSAEGINAVFNNGKGKLFSLPRDLGKDCSSRYIIYGGGGMIRPRFHEREVYKDFLKRKAHVKYAIHGVGLNKDLLGPEFTKEDIEAIREWVQMADSVSVRDMETKQFIERNTGISPAVVPCYSYEMLAEVHDKSGSIDKEFYLGLVPSFGHTYTYEQFRAEVEKFIDDISNQLDKSKILLICHDRNDYNYAIRRFKDICVYFPANVDDVNKAYSKCENTIALRGHGIIFSAACRVPCSPIPLCDKLTFLYEYHYNEKSPHISFNVEDHLNHLRRGVLPANLRLSHTAKRSV